MFCCGSIWRTPQLQTPDTALFFITRLSVSNSDPTNEHQTLRDVRWSGRPTSDSSDMLSDSSDMRWTAAEIVAVFPVCSVLLGSSRCVAHVVPYFTASDLDTGHHSSKLKGRILAKRGDSRNKYAH